MEATAAHPARYRLYYEVGTAVFDDLVGPKSTLMSEFEPDAQLPVLRYATGDNSVFCSFNIANTTVWLPA